MDKLHIFGDDYPTKDGTGICDYIHVVDLAKGHVNALDYINKHQSIEAFNLGTGKGYSVLEVVKAFEKNSGIKIPYVIDGRRSGDVAINYADPEKAKTLLNWKAEYNIDKMCKDVWNFYNNKIDLTEGGIYSKNKSL